ncbi:MAG: hypothetical protein LH606_16170 [Cytophagaceae bacterium]|nr:hypothetical protein [Cytophagaceae bacterium]
MAAPDFQQIFDTLKEDVVKLVTLTVSTHRDQAIDDANAFLTVSRDKLEQYTRLLVTGDLAPDDFAWLVSGLKSLAKMELLLQVGLAKIRVDQFVQSLLSLITDVIFRQVLA